MRVEIDRFCNKWLNKVDQIEGDDVEEFLDRFFSLYVVFNRLYIQASYELSQREEMNLENRESFPDRQAATNYIVQFYGSKRFLNSLNSNADTKEAILDLIGILDNELFNINIHPITGKPLGESDKELLDDLVNNNPNRKAKAILKFLYAIRCNIFHARKGADPIQVIVLQPTVTLLRKIIEMVRNDLD
jgi:hypothetical protein